MKRTTQYALLLTLALGICGSALAGRVSVNDLPPGVQAAITRSAAGGTVGEIQEQRQGDQIIYQTEITNPQGKRQVRIARDGTLLDTVQPEISGEPGRGRGHNGQVTTATSDLPPGIAKKQGGSLPPGLQKKADRGEPLPPPFRNGTFLPPGLANRGGSPTGPGAVNSQPGNHNEKPRGTAAGGPPGLQNTQGPADPVHSDVPPGKNKHGHGAKGPGKADPDQKRDHGKPNDGDQD
jgi:hypothetical protein